MVRKKATSKKDAKPRKDVEKKTMDEEESGRGRGEDVKVEPKVEKANVVLTGTVSPRGNSVQRSKSGVAETRPKGVSGGDVISVGIDLGTYQTCFSASNGIRDRILSVMGWPKDPVSRKFIGRDVVFGEEVLKRRLALDIYHPVEDLVFNTDDVDVDALSDFMSEIKNRVTGGKNSQVTALICIPSNVPKNYISRLNAACDGIFERVNFIAVPFSDAISLDVMHSLIVNIGASSINMGRIYGSIPTEDDLLTVDIGSRRIDEELVDSILKDYPKAQITTEMARAWKEQHSFIGRSKDKVLVSVPVEGVPTNIDITDYMETACSIVIKDLENGIRDLIASFDPEFQDLIRENVILTGNGSQIKGLPETLEEGLRDMRCKVRAIKDPMYVGADGALRILQDVPEMISE